MKKPVWRTLSPLGFSLLLAIALALSTGFLSRGPSAFANTCDPSNGAPFCIHTTGSVTVVQPTLHCGQLGNGESIINILQGCTGASGNNYQKIGRANWDNEAQQWVAQYGWTYTGTGDGQRYFTFNNYAYFQPIANSGFYVSFSDGCCVAGISCYGGGGSCDYQPWNNYQNAWISPTAQLRIWADGSQRSSPYYNQAFRPLEIPQPGISHCQGNGTGSATISANVGASFQGGSIGISSSQSITYAQNGQCNANSDLYSTYMNMNWEGGFVVAGAVFANVTTSAQSFFNVTATSGTNQSSSGSRYFLMDMNMMVNWWNDPAQTITSFDLWGNANVGPTAGNYAHDTWNY
jgi:hypothetical protein